MPRSYLHLSDYEKEILELREKGLTYREIGEQLGFSIKQVKNFLYRNNVKQRKIEAGIALKRKGRPPKDYQAPIFLPCIIGSFIFRLKRENFFNKEM